jgi:hypothetical protein
MAERRQVLRLGGRQEDLIYICFTDRPKGKYNSVGSCCLFDEHRQLNRQLVQWVVYLSVCKPFNSFMDT